MVGGVTGWLALWLLRGVGEGLEADSVAEGLELADRACLGFGGDTSSEVVGAGVTVEVAVGEHVPGRDEYGMLHGNKCFHRTPAGGVAPVFGREIGFLRAGRGQFQEPEW